jgi:hypothetical protein
MKFQALAATVEPVEYSRIDGSSVSRKTVSSWLAGVRTPISVISRTAVRGGAGRLMVAGSALLLLGLGSSAHAATDTKSLTVNATVSAVAGLTLGTASINFASANPGTTPSIAATEGPVSVTVNARTSTTGSVTLTVLAGGDLISGSDTIGINNVSWTASGSGFAAGTMNKTTPQSAGSWSGSGTRTGTFTYAMANSWSYASGSYTASVTYTLTAP